MLIIIFQILMNDSNDDNLHGFSEKNYVFRWLNSKMLIFGFSPQKSNDFLFSVAFLRKVWNSFELQKYL